MTIRHEFVGSGTAVVPVDRADPADAACDYEEDLLSFFTPREEGTPSFDIVLLGLATDGHTASLFPGSRTQEERERLVVHVPPSVAGLPRVSLSLPVINNDGAVIFLVTGREKREIPEWVIGGSSPALPASRVRPREGRLLVYSDTAAAPGWSPG